MYALRRLAPLLGFVATLAVVGCAKDAPLDTVPSVDLKRFQGQWYEVAKLPRPTQVDCRGTTATYKLTSDTTLDLVHQCHVGSLTGPLRLSAAHAEVRDTSATAKLAVDFGAGFYGDYWVIDLGENYQYAVIGHPSRQYLWILSRTPSLDTAVLGKLLDRAREKGFDTSKLEYTQQTP